MPKSFSEHVGGAFIYSEDPIKLAEWYKEHLGIDYKMTAVGTASFASFFYTEPVNGKKANFAWTIIKSKYRPKTEDESYMVNYRVSNLQKLVDHLKNRKIKVHGIETQAEGNFAWINDPEGNHIEIWEENSSK